MIEENVWILSDNYKLCLKYERYHKIDNNKDNHKNQTLLSSREESILPNETEQFREKDLKKI